MPNINQLLIKALYNDFDPNVDIDAQINFVNENYTSQDKFVEDFYKEYDTELTPEIKLFINRRFGGFEDMISPTVNVDDYDLSLKEESATFAAEGLLTKAEDNAIDNKFSDIGYFDKLVYKFQPTGDNIFEKGMNVANFVDAGKQKIVPTDTLQMYEDLGITKDDHKKNIEKEHKKLLNPHDYDLSDAEVAEINAIRSKVMSELQIKSPGYNLAELNQALLEEAKNTILEAYKQQYLNNITRSRVHNYIKNNDGYFGTLEELRKESSPEEMREAGFNELEAAGPGGYISDDPREFALQSIGGWSHLLAEVALDQREVPDKVKMLKQKSIIFEDIENFTKVSKKILEDHKNNEELGQEILAYIEQSSQPGFEFNAEKGLAMQKKLLLYKANQKAILQVLPKIQLANKNITSLSAASDLLGKNYDTLQRNLATTALGFGDLGLGGVRILSGVSNILPPMAAWATERAEMMDNISLKWNNYKDGVMNSYSPVVKFKDAFKSLDNFGEFAAQEIATQIPIFTTMIASGGLSGVAARGLGVTAKSTTNILGRTPYTLPLIEATGAGGFIGTASAGQQYNLMTAQEMRDPFLEFSEAEKFLVSAGYGASEGIFGTAPSYLLLRNTANLIIRSSGDKMVKEGMKRYFLNNLAFPVIAEPLSEGITQFSQNWLLDRPLMENVDHAMFSGFMFSIFMNAAPAAAGRMMQDFSNLTKMKEFNKINSEMNAIDKTLNRKNSKFKRNSTEWRSMRNTYRQLEMDRDAIVNDLFNNITTKVSKRSFKQFMENTSAQSEISLQAQKIMDAGGIILSSEDISALNSLQKEFDQLQFSRDIFRSQENFGNEFANLKGKDSNLYDLYIKKAKQNLKADGINDPSTVKTFQEASNLYFQDQFQSYTKNVKKNQLVNMKVFESNQDLINFIDSDPARKAEFDKKEKRWIVENGKLVLKNTTRREAVLRGDVNGINTTINGKKFELISKENSLNNERTGTGYHEFSHSVLFEALAARPEQYVQIATEIGEYLKKNQPKLFKLMFLSQGGQQIGGLKMVDGLLVVTNPEEVVVNFLERVGKGEIKDPKLIGVISESLSKASGMDINFRSEIDTIKFLYDLGLKIKNGTFKRSDLKSIKLNLRGKLNEAAKDVKDMPHTKFSDSDANIVQKLYNNLGAEAAPQIANNKYVRTIINEILRKYENVPGFTTYKTVFEDGLVNDPVYGILGSLLDYDAKKNPVLVSHIIARLRQRSKTLAEAIFPQFFSEGTDNRTYEETDPEILDQRESLRISLGLTPEIISKIKKSVLKTFGGKLPNVTSSKFRLKLQESFRIYLKKTIAKDVLGKGDAYRKFLEDNFELIYEVLSQSNINKRFKPFAERVLDKDGKQLREKTAQGNDVFIKRKITSEEFVNYFLGEDVGRSTQGTRKTALAEALAEEIAFDATLDVLRDPTPIDKFGNTLLDRVEQIIEINGEQFSENYLAQVAKEIDRATGFKFSDSSEGITVLDFDDTVAISKSKVIVNMPYYAPGSTTEAQMKITPAEFAKRHKELEEMGAAFDFSEFNTVIGGKKGPLFDRLQKAVNKFGNKNVFILTARPQEAAPAIKAWLKSQGIALSEKNIVGLSDGSPQAKADWILSKAEEGFNNFYFADDVLENTYAVEQVLSQIDVKYRIDQSPTKFSDSGKVEGLVEFLEKAIANKFTGDQLWESMKENNPLMYSKIVGKKKRGETEELFRALQLKGIFGDKIEIINMEELENVLKSSRKAQDINVLFKFKGGKEIGFEIKMNALTKMGSKNSYKTLLESYGQDVINEIVNIQSNLNDKIVDILNKEGLKEGTDYYFDKGKKGKEFGNGYVEIRFNRQNLYDKTGYNRLGRKDRGLFHARGLQLSDTNLQEINMSTLKPIVDLYTNKGAQYIIINGKIYSLATNPLNIDTASLLNLNYDTKVQVTMQEADGNGVIKPPKGKPKTLKYQNSGEGRLIIRGYLQMAEKGTTKNINPAEFNDIKGTKTLEEAFTNFSDSGVNLDNAINNIIEQSSGIKNIVRYSDTKAKLLGAKGFYRNELKGGFIFNFRADDLKGFTYEIMKGIKGELGNKAKSWFIENLHRPYTAGLNALNFETLKLMDDVKALKKKWTGTAGKLKKVIEGDVYTNDQAVRIYIWKKQGMDIPNIPKQDVADMVAHVKSDLSLLQFAEDIIKISSNKGYPAPELNWEAGTIDMDLAHDLNTRRRAENLKEWQENVDVIFSKKNLAKMRVAYGNEFVDQLTGMLERMRTGKNRLNSNKISRAWEEWINGSVGTVMFYNMRSALLQTISMANYVNWHDNNMFAAAKAFANQPQYWKDWIHIFNSDYLKIRRGGLRLNINEAELAEAAKKGGPKGIFALLLKNGFTPTRIADSLAIATGGASMYRNRIKSLLKKINPETNKKYTEQEAEKKAWEDFVELTEESQQSSRPDKISAQQASSMGRVLLAFANTPMQYNRIIKRAGQDLYYGRGDWRSNVSKIVYYSTIQNFIFNALQKGLYALGFGLYDDDEEKMNEKTTNVFEGMLDSLLSGFGMQGKVALSAKAFGKDFINSDAQGFYDSDWKNLLELSPTFSTKARQMMSADYLKDTYKDSKQWEEMSVRNPQLMWYAQYSSALFNIPLDRVLRKTHNLQSVFADETENWQKVALTLGWNEWDLGIEGMELHSEFGKKAIKTDEYLKEREETKENHQIKIDSIVNLGYTRIPLSGPKSFKPKGKEGVDYIRLKRKLDGNWQYFVPKEVFDKMFPPPAPPTTEEIIDKAMEDARKRLRKRGLTITN